MYHETIHANRDSNGSSRFDTVFVSVGDDEDVMGGLLVARVRLLFSYFDPYSREDIPCALVTWFIHPDPGRDEVTGMWKVCPEQDDDGQYPVQVIHLDTILRGAHLLPCYGKGFLPEGMMHKDALDAWEMYFVNQYIDYHAHELLMQSE
jgi:hypothetical protein